MNFDKRNSVSTDIFKKSFFLANYYIVHVLKITKIKFKTKNIGNASSSFHGTIICFKLAIT